MEFEANSILLKHDIMRKSEALDKLTKEHQKQSEANKELQQQLQEINAAVQSTISFNMQFWLIHQCPLLCSINN